MLINKKNVGYIDHTGLCSTKIPEITLTTSRPVGPKIVLYDRIMILPEKTIILTIILKKSTTKIFSNAAGSLWILVFYYR